VGRLKWCHLLDQFSSNTSLKSILSSLKLTFLSIRTLFRCCSANLSLSDADSLAPFQMTRIGTNLRDCSQLSLRVEDNSRSVTKFQISLARIRTEKTEKASRAFYATLG